MRKTLSLAVSGIPCGVLSLCLFVSGATENIFDPCRVSWLYEAGNMHWQQSISPFPPLPMHIHSRIPSLRLQHHSTICPMDRKANRMSHPDKQARQPRESLSWRCKSFQSSRLRLAWVTVWLPRVMPCALMERTSSSDISCSSGPALFHDALPPSISVTRKTVAVALWSRSIGEAFVRKSLYPSSNVITTFFFRRL